MIGEFESNLTHDCSKLENPQMIIEYDFVSLSDCDLQWQAQYLEYS